MLKSDYKELRNSEGKFKWVGSWWWEVWRGLSIQGELCQFKSFLKFEIRFNIFFLMIAFHFNGINQLVFLQ